jgi:hypothetical protein
MAQSKSPRGKAAQDKTVKEAVSELRRGVDLLDTLVRPPARPASVPETFTLAAGLPRDKRVFRIVVRGPVDVDGTTTVALTQGATKATLTETKRGDGELIAEASLPLSSGTWTTTLSHGGQVQQTMTTEVL